MGVGAHDEGCPNVREIRRHRCIERTFRLGWEAHEQLVGCGWLFRLCSKLVIAFNLSYHDEEDQTNRPVNDKKALDLRYHSKSCLRRFHLINILKVKAGEGVGLLVKKRPKVVSIIRHETN